MYSYNTDDTDVDSFSHTIETNTITVLYKNNKQPDYYTTFNDNTILFDSLDLALETTLQKSNSLCYAQQAIAFELTDSFTPDLDEVQFTLLLNEAKSLAWAELKQSQHGIAERNIRRGWSSIQKNKEAIKGLSDFDKLPYYGRR